MFVQRLISCAALIALCTPGFAASKPAPKAKAAKTAKAPAGPQRLKGKHETLACRLGTEDRHARIAVVLIGGKTDSFAYYSKWKPRTCSIYLQRWRDSYSKWDDNGPLTTVSLERGAFLIEHKKNEYHFIFRDIDRERYCGMDGVINGSLTIKKGSDQCQLDGDIMVEGTPLGEAVVNREEDKPPPGLTPASVPSAGGADASAGPEKSATAAIKPSAAEQPSATAAVKPAAVAAPAASARPEAPKPEAAKAEPAKSESAKAEPAKAQPEPAVQADAGKTDAAKVDPANPPAARAEPAKAEPQKAAESSSNPLRSFFHSFSTTRNPDAQ